MGFGSVFLGGGLLIFFSLSSTRNVPVAGKTSSNNNEFYLQQSFRTLWQRHLQRVILFQPSG